MKTAQIIAKYHNDFGGVNKDVNILTELLQEMDIEVKVLNLALDNVSPIRADINIVEENLELDVIDILKSGKKNILIPHPECFLPYWKNNLSKFDSIFTKTRAAEKIFNDLKCENVRYISWTSLNQFNPDIPKNKNHILHAPGNSRFKNTQAVIRAWESAETELPRLIFTHTPELLDREFVWRTSSPNITQHVKIFNEQEFIELQNSYLFQLCPSQYEGFGHYINEAKSTGAIIITVDAPPMNEITHFNYTRYIKPYRVDDFNIAELFHINHEDLIYVIKNKIIPLMRDKTTMQEMSVNSRLSYLHNDNLFRALFRSHFMEILNSDKISNPVKKKHVDSYLFTKKRSRPVQPIILKEKSPLPSLSIVTRCMNRAVHLKETLPTWLQFKEPEKIIILDWSSSEDILSMINDYQDGRIYHVYVPGHKYFHRSKSLNTGIRYVDTELVLHIDVDIKLSPGFFDALNIDNPDTFYSLAQYFLGGTCIFSKRMFLALNGYNEHFFEWGWEDVDFQNRMKEYFPVKKIPTAYMQHIDHPRNKKFINQPNPISDINKKKMGWWNGMKQMEKFACIITEPSGKKVKAII